MIAMTTALCKKKKKKKKKKKPLIRIRLHQLINIRKRFDRIKSFKEVHCKPNNTKILCVKITTLKTVSKFSRATTQNS